MNTILKIKKNRFFECIDIWLLKVRISFYRRGDYIEITIPFLNEFFEKYPTWFCKILIDFRMKEIDFYKSFS